MDFLKLFIPVLFASLFNTIANSLWKYHLIKKHLNLTSFANILTLFFVPNIILGVIFYVFSMLLFFYMLSNFKLSVIIPLTSLTYIFNLLAAFFLFHEKISITQIVGVIIIVAGIIVVSRSSIA